MAQLQIPLPRLIGSRQAMLVGIALMTGMVLWVAAFTTGLCPWLGYTSQSRRSVNIGGLPVAEMSSGRVRLGFGTFVFFAGQTIVLAYDARISDGCMSMHVWRISDRSADFDQCVKTSGKGEWTVPVTETGLYHIFVTSRPIQGRWDMSYAVWWGAKQ
ncbi:MAG TPA: hypothetical protein VF113_16715 [Stellaceae bacterium]